MCGKYDKRKLIGVDVAVTIRNSLILFVMAFLISRCRSSCIVSTIGMSFFIICHV